MVKSFYVGDALGRQGDWSDNDKKFAENINIKKIYSPDYLFAITDDKQVAIKSFDKQEIIEDTLLKVKTEYFHNLELSELYKLLIKMLLLPICYTFPGSSEFVMHANGVAASGITSEGGFC